MSEETGVPPFDAIRHESDGGEYWSARELASLGTPGGNNSPASLPRRV